jgi:hypothetical protein
MDVRIEQGVFHFVLGEMVPGKDGKPEFVPAFRCVLPESDAVSFFSYLKDKAEDARSLGLTPARGESRASEREKARSEPSPKLFVQTDRPSEEVVRKRKIATTNDEPHRK